MVLNVDLFWTESLCVIKLVKMLYKFCHTPDFETLMAVPSLFRCTGKPLSVFKYFYNDWKQEISLHNLWIDTRASLQLTYTASIQTVFSFLLRLLKNIE